LSLAQGIFAQAQVLLICLEHVLDQSCAMLCGSLLVVAFIRFADAGTGTASPAVETELNVRSGLRDPSKGWTCEPADAKFFQDYCDKYTSPKSFAMTADCQHAYEWHGGSDATNTALDNCAKDNNGQECFTYDNNGRMCFSKCVHSWPQSYAVRDWAKYCNSRTKKKAWSMPDDCSSYGYSINSDDVSSASASAKQYCEKESNGKPCHLFDDNGADMGPRCLPACLQLEPEWCWATATLEISSYWNPTKFPVTGDDCTGLECQVASHKTGKDCCADPSNCDAGNSIDVDFIQNVAGGPAYEWTSGQLSDADLQNALALGPLIVRIAWPDDKGAHFVTVGGYDAEHETYFLHDSLVENQAGKYQDVSYASIQTYREPAGRYTGTWDGTVHVASGSGSGSRDPGNNATRATTIVV